MTKRALWKQTLSARWVWIRSIKIGLFVGVLQVLLHQGDVMFTQGITRAMVTKCIVSPLIAFSVAFYATASTQVDRQSREIRGQVRGQTELKP